MPHLRSLESYQAYVDQRGRHRLCLMFWLGVLAVPFLAHSGRIHGPSLNWGFKGYLGLRRVSGFRVGLILGRGMSVISGCWTSGVRGLRATHRVDC